MANKVERPAWGADATGRIFKMDYKKTEFAKLLGVNYTEFCNVLLGHRVNPKLQEKILAKLDELEGAN